MSSTTAHNYAWDDYDQENEWQELPWYSRMLADKRLYIDYSVLSVGVMTLGLILVVEVLRHRIDHAAVGRPFFQAVLEGVYSELATLGIVEFFLYVLSTYYENLNKDRYYVFADVHFALFYTAILNAFQSVILAVVTSRVSRKLWIVTEELELNHYVEIREGFEQVKREMNLADDNNDSNTNEQQQSKTATDSSNEDLEVSLFRTSGLQSLWKSFVYRVRYPAMRRKYHELLLQIRFHELRVHFLQAYKLPLKLKVSDYLMRSEQQVLLKLVHVSSIAWLLLTGAVNVLYYILGLMSYKLGESDVISDALVWVFYLCMSVFVIIATLVYYKMKAIFREIMVEKTLWDVHDTADEEKKERLAEQQLALFWGGDPKLVIAGIQFMQFGFAVALAVVIIYWNDIEDGTIPVWTYPFSIGVCYSLFVLVTAQVIPRYTLCTSLGQLVDKEQLHQTLAAFKLAEAQREKPEQLVLEDFDQSLVATQKKPAPALAPTSLSDNSAQGSISSHSQRQGRAHSNVSTRSSTPEASPKPARPAPVDQATLMAELVKLDTDSLRGTLPEGERNQLALRQMERANRRTSRRKTRSEGVGAMAAMGRPLGALGDMGLGSLRRTGSQAKDDTFLSSAHSRKEDSMFLPKLKLPTLKPSTSSEKLEPEDTQMEALQARRRRRHQRRQKAVSDGVAAMARMHERNFASLNVPGPVIEEHPEEHTDHGEFSPMSGNIIELPPSIDPHVPEEPKPAPLLKPGSSSMSLSSGNDLFGLGKSITNSIQDDDNYSIASEGGFSDDDDVPEVDPTAAKQGAEKGAHQIPLVDRLSKLFLSRKYVVLSNVFGTMVSFYMIAQRVEKFLHTEGVVSERPVTFEFNNEITFWVLMVLFSSFLCVDVLIMYLFGPRNGTNRVFRERKAFIAAAMDFVLVSACLSVFVAAEVKRCCYEARRLAEDPEYGYDKGDSYGYDDEKIYLDPPTCGCPRFGSRLYSGLGTLEPYSSLVSLRLFRHFVAKRVVSYLEHRKDPNDPNTGMQLDPFSVFEDTDQAAGHDSHGHSIEMKGTAAELWEAAVVKHPELVEQFGEFSSEILKAMLGIQVGGQKPILPPKDESEDIKTALDETEQSTLAKTAPQSFALGKEFSNLTAEAQGVILAGKLGRSVSVNNLANLDRGHGTIPEHEEAPHAESGAVLFELGQGESDTLLPGQEVFLSPNARLVRSMRRCDRKLLPILDKWAVVDVVMTKYEIVYFDATDVDGPSDDVAINGVREAVSATKGGKGLRLRDIALGRRVVGRLELSEIECVTVEREMPVEGGAVFLDDGPEVEVSEVEWWKHSQGNHKMEGSRAEKWSTIKEDRLRIQTIRGRTLYLRFYSDLDDAETHMDRLEKEDEVEGELFKNNALQWVQTLGRFLGPDQLKQSLPHFGDTSSDELRDYLVVHCHHNADSEHKGGLHRRTASTGELVGLRFGISRKRAANKGKAPTHSRLQSIDSAIMPSPNLPSKPKSGAARSKSMGTSPSNTNDVEANDNEVASSPQVSSVDGAKKDAETFGADP